MHPYFSAADVVAVTNCSDPAEIDGFPNSPRTITYYSFSTPFHPKTAHASGGAQTESETVAELEEYQSYQFRVRVWNNQGPGPEDHVMVVCNRTLEAGRSL